MNISSSKRLIVKIGSRLLIDEQKQTLHQRWLESLLDDVMALRQQGVQVVLVSSGAVAYGKIVLKIQSGYFSLDVQQAAAAVGQVQLMHTFQTLLAARGCVAGQILLTLQDMEHRRRFINGRNSIERLIRMNVIPIINENDSIATNELRYGDNDRLAARVAQMIDADTLVLLSDIDGLYTQDPHVNPTATLIPCVQNITAEVTAMGGESATHYGSGGMMTKLAAAKIAMQSGCRLLITRGSWLNPLSHHDQHQRGTWFIPEITVMKAKKRWLKQHLKPAGKVMIDAGAVGALLEGKSLLPIGVRAVSGHFDKGEVISVVDQEQQEVARGLTNYSISEAQKIMGYSTCKIEQLLGYKGCDEIVFRNNLVLTCVQS